MSYKPQSLSHNLGLWLTDLYFNLSAYFKKWFSQRWSVSHRPRSLSLFFFLFSALLVQAQNFAFELPETPPSIKIGNKTLSNAWAGGINAAQFSVFDLHNGDQISDLVVFDRFNAKVSTFIGNNDSPKTYTYQPEYEAFFPKDLDNWLLLIDYNNDGEKDLFTFTPQGIRLLKNSYKTNGKIAWDLVANPIFTQGFSGKVNLYVASSDIPAITDIDDDGDIDILTFDFSGNIVEFHKNFSQEEKSSSLVFKRQGFCWGDFYKEHCRDIRFTIDCQTGIINNGTQTFNNLTTKDLRTSKTLHSGNTLLITDLNNDKKKDVLFGHITCQNIAFLPNSGSNQAAIFKTVAYDYPATNAINFKIFPAVFAGNFTGNTLNQTELIASPNVYQNEGNLIDFQHSAWLYSKDSEGNYQLKQSDFLQETMLDLGENTSPLLVDIDGDGDQDLLVGNGGARGEKGYRGSIYLFRNKGTKLKASFELENDDFLGISDKLVSEQNNLITNVKPFVADLNADGVLDFGFSAATFNGLEIRYLPNKGARNGAFVMNIQDLKILPSLKDANIADSPTFYDIDQDGDQDILMAKSFGTVNLFRNSGTPNNPKFDLEDLTYGNINTDYQTRGLQISIADLNADQKPELISSNASGKITIFPDFLSNKSWQADTTMSLFLKKKIFSNSLGNRLAMAFGELNADNLPDLVLGNNTGGLRLLTNNSKAENIPPSNQDLGLIYPNPSTGFIYVRFGYYAQIELIDMLGRCLLKQEVTANQETALDGTSLGNGLYVIRASANGQASRCYKVLITR